MADALQIGVIGDFNAANLTHIATDSGVQHAAELLGEKFEVLWLPTDEVHDWRRFDGLLCSPGSPYRSLAGALTGIRYARENGIPFMGTCGGFQHLVLEVARDVMGIDDAAHAETDPYASRLFITPLSCSLKGTTMEVRILPDSRAAKAYGAAESAEQYYCNFGLNPDCREPLDQAGLRVTGVDAMGEVRIMEYASHSFCMGTLFVPQAKSRPGKPHPLVVAFCRAAMAR